MKTVLCFGLLIEMIGCGVPTAQDSLDETIKIEKQLLNLTKVEMDTITEYAHTVDEMRDSSPKPEAVFQSHKAAIIAKLEAIKAAAQEISPAEVK